jgi:hypothetical protein
MPEVFATHSRGSLCQICGDRIKPDDVEYEIAAATLSSMRTAGKTGARVTAPQRVDPLK